MLKVIKKIEKIKLILCSNLLSRLIMSKCLFCGREIGSTAGPCVQCTLLRKKDAGVLNISSKA